MAFLGNHSSLRSHCPNVFLRESFYLLKVPHEQSLTNQQLKRPTQPGETEAGQGQRRKRKKETRSVASHPPRPGGLHSFCIRGMVGNQLARTCIDSK
jgi:hypothetical protein